MTTGLKRREFLKCGTIATAAVAAEAGHGASPDDAKTAVTGAIPACVFGKTEAKLPRLSFGGAALPKEWGNPLSHEDRLELVRYAYDRGIRHFDTAGNYMESQAILGEALQDVRDKIFLVSKVETTVPGHVRKAVENSLAELRTDYLDSILIHGTPGLEQMSVERAMEIHAELRKLNDEGMIRSIGFSAHAYFDKALPLIETGGFDHCMLSYGYIPRGYDQLFSPRMVELRNTCLAKAHERGMGIVAMKVMGAGVLGAWSGYIVPGFDKAPLAQLPGAAMRHVLHDPRVHLLTIGMRLQHEIDANIKLMAGDTTYTLEDRALLAEFSAQALDSDALRKMRTV